MLVRGESSVSSARIRIRFYAWDGKQVCGEESEADEGFAAIRT